ncbi:MAG: periplasmic heavy metal sensor [Acidobacteriota bacterium]
MKHLLAILLLFPAILPAQRGGPGGPGGPIAWWENPVASGLNLTENQRTRINKIVADHRDRIVAARIDAESAERELEAVYNSEVVDWARGSFAIDRLVKARGEVTKDISEMTLRLRKVLTLEQWRTLLARQEDARPGEGREGGREGIGRRGGRPPASGSQPFFH